MIIIVIIIVLSITYKKYLSALSYALTITLKHVKIIANYDGIALCV